MSRKRTNYNLNILGSYLGAFNRNNSVKCSWGIVKEWYIDSCWWGWKPWPLGFGVDVEHVSLARENRLLPVMKEKKKKRLMKLVVVNFHNKFLVNTWLPAIGNLTKCLITNLSWATSFLSLWLFSPVIMNVVLPKIHFGFSLLFVYVSLCKISFSSFFFSLFLQSRISFLQHKP